MTKDECLHLACEVALRLKPGDALTMPLTKAIMRAVAEEREECAKIAEEGAHNTQWEVSDALREYARRIRARGK